MKTKNKLRKALGLYQTLGGLIGIALTVYILLNSEEVLPLVMASILAVLAIYLFITYSGYLLFKGNKNAFRYSLVSQILQIPYFVIGAFLYQVVAGGHLTIHLLFQDAAYQFGYQAYIGSTFNISFLLQNNTSVLVGINILPLIFIFLLKKAAKNDNQAKLF